MEDLYVNFTVAITRLGKLIQRIKSYEINKFDLEPIHVSCGYYLSKNSQGLTAKQLAALAIEDKGAISRALKKMQDRGLVEYASSGRNKVVKLTAEGRKLSKTIEEKVNSAVKAGSAHISNEQRKFFYDSLVEITDNLMDYYQKLIKG